MLDSNNNTLLLGLGSALPLFIMLTRFNASQNGGCFYDEMETWDP